MCNLSRLSKHDIRRENLIRRKLTIIDHRMETCPGKYRRLSRAQILLNDTDAVLLDHHRVRRSSNRNNHVVLTMLVGWEHGARAEIELRNGCAHALQSRPRGLICVADRARVGAVLPLRVGCEVVLPLIAASVGEDFPTVQHGWREEELVIQEWISVRVNGRS